MPDLIEINQADGTLREITLAIYAPSGALLTGLTEADVTIKTAKPGAALSASAATLTEVAGGDGGGYRLRFPLDEVDTLGDLDFEITSGTTTIYKAFGYVTITAASSGGGSGGGVTAAQWTPNTVVDAERVCDLVINTDTGDPAPRATDFTNCVYIHAGTDEGTLGAGTIHNKRIPTTFADLTITSTDTGADTVAVGAHSVETGTGPVRVDSTLGGLDAATDYWIWIGPENAIGFAESPSDAYAGVLVDLTADITGVNIVAQATCSVGLDGEFQYTATQAESDVSVGVLFLTVIKDGFARARANVTVRSPVQGFESLGEGANTYGDIMRAIYALLGGLSGDYTTGTFTFKDPTTGTIVRFTITADATGRKVVTPGVLTGP